MIFVSYRWTHIPTGKTGLREGLPCNCLADFMITLCRWNTFEPDKWKYILVRVNKTPHISTYSGEEPCEAP